MANLNTLCKWFKVNWWCEGVVLMSHQFTYHGEFLEARRRKILLRANKSIKFIYIFFSLLSPSFQTDQKKIKKSCWLTSSGLRSGSEIKWGNEADWKSRKLFKNRRKNRVSNQQVCTKTERENKWTHCKYFKRHSQVEVDTRREHHHHRVMSNNKVIECQ